MALGQRTNPDSSVLMALLRWLSGCVLRQKQPQPGPDSGPEPGSSPIFRPENGRRMEVVLEFPCPRRSWCYARSSTSSVPVRYRGSSQSNSMIILLGVPSFRMLRYRSLLPMSAAPFSQLFDHSRWPGRISAPSEDGPLACVPPTVAMLRPDLRPQYRLGLAMLRRRSGGG